MNIKITKIGLGLGLIAMFLFVGLLNCSDSDDADPKTDGPIVKYDGGIDTDASTNDGTVQPDGSTQDGSSQPDATPGPTQCDENSKTNEQIINAATPDFVLKETITPKWPELAPNGVLPSID